MHRGEGFLCSHPDAYKGKEILFFLQITKEGGKGNALSMEIWYPARSGLLPRNVQKTLRRVHCVCWFGLFYTPNSANSLIKFN